MFLKCILYIEFDNDEGPVIRYQAPSEDVFSFRRVFDKIKLLFITNRELCNRVITINDAFGYKVIGYPLRLDHEKYERNALSFNVSFVFDESVDARQYEPVLVKLATSIENLEVESEFLSRPHTREVLGSRILPGVYGGLVANGNCAVRVDSVNSINLKLFPYTQSPPPVKSFEVPVRIRNFRQLKADDETLKRIIPYINGVNYVQKIAFLAQVDLVYVCDCIRHLVFFNCVAMVDIFQFSNVYVPTTNVGKLYHSERLRRECMQFVVIDSASAAHSDVIEMVAGDMDTDRVDIPMFRKIFKLFCSLERGERMSVVCSKEPLFQHVVDPRRFAIFGVIHGLIRRVHRYPIQEASLAVDDDLMRNRGDGALFDGTRSYDELCALTGKSYAELDGSARNMANCFIISK